MPLSPSHVPPQSTHNAAIVLYGGTFDPVHYGHLRIAAESAASLQWSEIRLIPSKKPVHRKRPGATDAQRLAMLRIAVDEFPELNVDSCELERTTPSYTVLTLQDFRQRFPQRPLIWLIGIDAFMHIDQWYEWPSLFELAHFVVLNRPGYPVAQALTPALADVWQGRLSHDSQTLQTHTHGSIYLHTVTPQAISATEIRNKIAIGYDNQTLTALLPATVLAYIRTHKLYLADPNH